MSNRFPHVVGLGRSLSLSVLVSLLVTTQVPQSEPRNTRNTRTARTRRPVHSGHFSRLSYVSRLSPPEQLRLLALAGHGADLDPATLERLTGFKGTTKTWAAFAGTDDNALVDGDFAMTEDELQPVLKSLRASGINIVAIHHHMTHEKPRYIFLHYWGRGRAEALAQSLRKALATQKAQK